MRIYRLKPDTARYKDLVLHNEADARLMSRLAKGVPAAADWKPVGVEVLDDAENRKRLPGDYPSFNSLIPVLSSGAVEALRDLLEPNGELLPLLSSEGKYTAFNVTRLEDALDVERSEIWHFPNSNKIVDISRHVFQPERLTGAAIFKLAQRPRGGKIYVTDEFVRRVQNAGLVGFDFQQVWPEQKG